MEVSQTEQWTIKINKEEAFLIKQAIKYYLLQDICKGTGKNIIEHCELMLEQIK